MPLTKAVRRVVLSVATTNRLGLATLGVAIAIVAMCVAFLIYSSIPWVLMPADILSWSEGGFVGDVIKLLTGVPFYTRPQDSNSMIYTPGAPWASFAVLTALRQTVSIPALRLVQALFVLLAALVATFNIRVMRRMIFPGQRIPYKLAWTVLAVLLLILAATSPRVNRLVLTLHSDGLVLLASMVYWWALLRYVENPKAKQLVMLSLMPAIGFGVKPFLLAWLPVTIIVAAMLPFKNLRQHVSRLLLLVAASSVATIGLIGLFYSWWGHNFGFWVFDVMGGRKLGLSGTYNIALLRSADHLLRAWWELSLGVIAFLLTLRRGPERRVIALFVGWSILIAGEAVTSGAGWNVLYHFGPSVMIGLTWLLAVLPAASRLFDETLATPAALANRLTNAVVFVACIFSICIALHALPTRDRKEERWFPGARPSDALYSQVESIEAEFKGYKPEEVLLDVGNWVYLDSRFLALDRAVSLADQPISGHFENFQPLLQRIRQTHYKKILLHDFHDQNFLYDHWLWKERSGVRQALMEHYKEVRTIPAAPDDLHDVFTGAVSVLVPKETL